jgi:hypothetical protein
MTNTERILYEFLVESNYMTKNNFVNLTEENKIETIKDIVISLLKNITEKINQGSTLIADKSRGDIKQLKELDSLQTAITQLETLTERAGFSIPEECNRYLKEIIKSILFLNQYSLTFKDAYRGKKTLLILKYQSLIFSIFLSVSYLISTMIDYNVEDNIVLKNNIKIEEITPLKTLMQFNKSVESGEFKIILKDTALIRENFQEVSVEEMGTLYEASDIIDVVKNGIKNFYNSIDKSNRITSILYKAAGVIVLILSLREVFYTLYRTKTKFSEVADNIKNFANINLGGSLNKIISFGKRFAVDVEEASQVSKYDIDAEDKNISSTAKTVPMDIILKNKNNTTDDNDENGDAEGISVNSTFNF